MSEERNVPLWAQTVGAALGLLFALPFGYLVVVEWLELVRRGGWFGYVIVVWAVGWLAWLVFQVVGGWIEYWFHLRRGLRIAEGDDLQAP